MVQRMASKEMTGVPGRPSLTENRRFIARDRDWRHSTRAPPVLRIVWANPRLGGGRRITLNREIFPEFVKHFAPAGVY